MATRFRIAVAGFRRQHKIVAIPLNIILLPVAGPLRAISINGVFPVAFFTTAVACSQTAGTITFCRQKPGILVRLRHMPVE